MKLDITFLIFLSFTLFVTGLGWYILGDKIVVLKEQHYQLKDELDAVKTSNQCFRQELLQIKNGLYAIHKNIAKK